MASDPIDINGYQVIIMADGYEKGVEPGRGPWRKIVYNVAWDESDVFIDSLLGISMVGMPMGGTFNPPQPHRYPGNPNIVAMSCVARPEGALGPDPVKLVKADRAIIEVLYGVPQFDVFGTQTNMAFGGQAEPWCRDEIRGFLESYTIPADRLEMEDSGDQPDRSFAIKVPHLELRRTRMNVPYLYMPVLLTLMGKLNHDLFWGFPRGTLRFEPFEMGVETDAGGNRVATLITPLSWRPYDWNMVPRTDGPGWDYVRFLDGTDNPYDYADFGQAYGVWR